MRLNNRTFCTREQARLSQTAILKFGAKFLMLYKQPMLALDLS